MSQRLLVLVFGVVDALMALEYETQGRPYYALMSREGIDGVRR